jgi:transposase
MGGLIDHPAAMARMNLSPKSTANWALATAHSLGGIFHSFSERFKINAFCRLKDFRRVHTRYDKLAANFLSAVALATAAAFWL